MKQGRYASFQEFWPFYLSQHSNPICRRLHFLGTSIGILAVATALLFDLRFIFVAPVVGYAFAWVGHFFFEKNKPATFQYPIWSFLGDLKMLSLFLRGQLETELNKVKSPS